VLVNAWDVASARAVAASGAAAIATSSGAMNWMLGEPDGTGAAADGFFEMVARISQAVAPLPLTVDVEAGFGSTPAQVAAAVRKVVSAGAVGVNIEDGRPAGGIGAALFDIEEQQVRLRAARAAADALGIPLVINARIDVFLAEVGEPAGRLQATVERAHAYRTAGADCVFVPAVRDEATIAELAGRIEGPLNVLALPGSPPLGDLARLGVARVSFGSWPARAVLGLVQRIVQSVTTTGGYSQLDGALSYDEAQSLLSAATVAGAAGAPTGPVHPVGAQPVEA
jgi:2-methylisocitrate lyase-like PEP mutase family enzyme